VTRFGEISKVWAQFYLFGRSLGAFWAHFYVFGHIFLPLGAYFLKNIAQMIWAQFFNCPKFPYICTLYI
jgi:hypothetical protein